MIVTSDTPWWRKFLKWMIHGDRPDEPAPTPRSELLAARDRLQRQIDVLASGPLYSRDRTPQTPRLLDDLQAALDGIEEELAQLDRFSPPSEPRRPSPPSAPRSGHGRGGDA